VYTEYSPHLLQFKEIRLYRLRVNNNHWSEVTSWVLDTCYTSISFNAFSRRSISSAMLSSVLSTSFRSTSARTDSSLACGSCTTCVLISSLLVANLLGNRLRSRLGTSLHFTSGLVLNIQNKIDVISHQNVEMRY